jgi:hypothetical protein
MAKRRKPVKPTAVKKKLVIPLTQEDRELREAINEVYKKYGTDLDSFYRDVDAELEIKRQERPRTQD